ncbi:hypothetical protein B0E37_06090 [Streptomyces sp. MH192]|nr:hypothetical protein [Streptomyces sp. MH192]MCF0103455.1 hypothetical protein [Streptomyces sp. MH191]
MPRSQAESVTSCHTARTCRAESCSPRPWPPSRTARRLSRHSIGSSGTSRTSRTRAARPRICHHGGPPSPAAVPARADSVGQACSRFCSTEQLSSAEGSAEADAEADSVTSGASDSSPAGVRVCVYSGVVPRFGVGSKRVQPTPSKYSSGHACASRSPTDIDPSACAVPGVKPTATRAGMPSVRAIEAIAKEKWTQKPRLSRRKRAIAPEPVPTST